jgi:acetyl esterase
MVCSVARLWVRVADYGNAGLRLGKNDEASRRDKWTRHRPGARAGLYAEGLAAQAVPADQSTEESPMTRAHELMEIPPRGGHDAPEGFVPFAASEAQRAQLQIEEKFVPGPVGAPDVRVLVYRPKSESGTLPVLVHFHGGGFCMLRPQSFSAMDAGWSLTNRCVVVSVDYRLAPEAPFPAAPEDCYAALLWVAASAADLDVDLGRLVVTGGSAGGALSAAVALMARDRSGPKIALQALMIPVLDDRLETASTAQAKGGLGFNAENAEGMWIHYLGEGYDRSQTSPYAAPARAADLSGLPPAFVQTNGLDPLRDEGILYAMRLMAAGIPVELYNAPGCYHGHPPVDERAMLQAMRVYSEALGAALRPAGN